MKISVVMITYLHEKYISEAINSIFNQKGDFEIELIIANDNSPDQTDLIIKNLIKQCPNNFSIKYLNRESNMGMTSNFSDALSQASGIYIALCEGDDYWTDPYKLKKQLDIIEKESNCNIVFHNCMIVDQFGNNLKLVYDQDYNRELTFIDLLNGEYTKTCTVLLRNGLIKKDNLIVDDVVIFMEALENGGSAIFIPDVMSHYRIHEGGIWSMKPASNRFLQAEVIEKYLFNRYKTIYPDLILARFINFYFAHSIQLLISRYYKLSVSAFYKYLKQETSLNKGMKNILRYFKCYIVSIIKKK
jgi:glycosyltransferase involved in cell wall biosynthesis